MRERHMTGRDPRPFVQLLEGTLTLGPVPRDPAGCRSIVSISSENGPVGAAGALRASGASTGGVSSVAILKLSIASTIASAMAWRYAGKEMRRASSTLETNP